jgi:hypothetical protein
VDGSLETIYALLRAGQDEVGLAALGPVEGMHTLVRDTFRQFREHPEIVALMNEENLHRARHLRAAGRIPALHDPPFATIENLLTQAREAGILRSGVDVTALYVALSGLGHFYGANRWTLSSAFAGDLFAPERIARFEAMIADMIVAYLRAPDGTAPLPQAPRGSTPPRLR